MLLIVGCTVAIAWLFTVVGDRTAVLVAGRDIAAGQVISEQDLAEAQISGSGLSAVPVSGREVIVGRVARGPVPAGALLSSGMVAQDPLPGPGQVAVGLALKPGQMPAELSAGRRGDVLLVPTAGTSSGEGKVLARGGQVVSVTASAAGGWIVTVVIGQESALEVSQAAAGGRVALVMLALGGS